MSGFREHFLDKYFGYRSRYVAAVAELAPGRRSLAVLSEVARLCFSLAGCALVAFVVGVLLVEAWTHDPRPLKLALLGAGVAVPLAFIGFILGGFRDAWRDRAPSARAPR